MLVFFSLLGGVLIYEVFGNISGLDATGLAGMCVGFIIGLFSGKHFGILSLYPSFLSSLIGSLFFILLAFLSISDSDPITSVLGELSIGFCLMAGTIVGCQWGGHLMAQEIKEQESQTQEHEHEETAPRKRMRIR